MPAGVSPATAGKLRRLVEPLSPPELLAPFGVTALRTTAFDPIAVETALSSLIRRGSGRETRHDSGEIRAAPEGLPRDSALMLSASREALGKSHYHGASTGSQHFVQCCSRELDEPGCSEAGLRQLIKGLKADQCSGLLPAWDSVVPLLRVDINLPPPYALKKLHPAGRSWPHPRLALAPPPGPILEFTDALQIFLKTKGPAGYLPPPQARKMVGGGVRGEEKDTAGANKQGRPLSVPLSTPNGRL
ncbi:hypothetical protein AAFF_G00229220 [Aldrovandia affinis]|uniref:Uncharacterized protein n=1 Tax=Aldrovandia affinis TaxID=143900 RepID=A0AAD7SX91_9TELE|nr:hypothetical protein AAFF_G00229220 [Aldrovandia affinis]